MKNLTGLLLSLILLVGLTRPASAQEQAVTVDGFNVDAEPLRLTYYFNTEGQCDGLADKALPTILAEMKTYSTEALQSSVKVQRQLVDMIAAAYLNVETENCALVWLYLDRVSFDGGEYMQFSPIELRWRRSEDEAAEGSRAASTFTDSNPYSIMIMILALVSLVILGTLYIRLRRKMKQIRSMTPDDE